MVKGRESYLRYLSQAIRHPGISLALANGAFQHRRMEQEFNYRLQEVCPVDSSILFPHMELPAPQYWQRNFFSILFLTIFEALGISKARQHLYGMILHALRGIVTSTDNILDNESKGSVRLELSGGKVLPNVLIMLMETGVLHQLIFALSGDIQTANNTWRHVFEALFSLGAEETHEEGRIETVLEPKALLDEIHRFRGGGLLLLAFVVPEVNEPQLSEKIRIAKSGVNHIGLALQILDDITDFEEDLVNRNHNMLRSWVVHNHPDGYADDQSLAQLESAALQNPEKHFPIATKQVMHLAIEIALVGFDRLNKIGHPVDRIAARELIETMFSLRGLERLWSVYEDYVVSGDHQAIDCTPYFPVL